jgi:hypothetical protein
VETQGEESHLEAKETGLREKTTPTHTFMLHFQSLKYEK